MPVHYVGQPADLDPLISLASSRGIAVLEDAAHAVGTEYRGRRIGSFPTTSVFSFHPNKNMTTGEGGMIVTDDEGVFERASLLKFHGMDREAWKRFSKEGSPRYDVAIPGFKYNMMDIQAALGLHQLKRLDGFIAERTRLAARYDAALRGLAGLILPARVPYPARHAWHLYTPLVDIDRLTISRDRFMAELKASNVGTGLHYTAAHEFSYYAGRFGWKAGDFPEAHFVSERIVSLPLFPGLSDDDQDDADRRDPRGPRGVPAMKTPSSCPCTTRRRTCRSSCAGSPRSWTPPETRTSSSSWTTAAGTARSRSSRRPRPRAPTGSACSSSRATSASTRRSSPRSRTCRATSS